MNCETFNERLPEYLEDALSAADQAAAREHVEKCGACQGALARQEALGEFIRLSFQRETQRLSVRPETRRNVLNALKEQENLPTVWERIPALLATLWRHPAWAGAFLVCLAVFIFGSRFYSDLVKSAGTGGTVEHDRMTCVIDVPMQAEMHVFRSERNMVVDAVVTENSVIDASFSEDLKSSRSLPARVN